MSTTKKITKSPRHSNASRAAKDRLIAWMHEVDRLVDAFKAAKTRGVSVIDCVAALDALGTRQ